MSINEEKKWYGHPGWAAILSFIYSGLGQLYNGQIKKGLIIIFLTSTGVILTVLGAILIGHYLLSDLGFRLELIWAVTLLIVGLTLICCTGIYSIFDAYNTAKRKLIE